MIALSARTCAALYAHEEARSRIAAGSDSRRVRRFELDDGRSVLGAVPRRRTRLRPLPQRSHTPQREATGPLGPRCSCVRGDVDE